MPNWSMLSFLLLPRADYPKALSCPNCRADNRWLMHLGDIEPQMVKGDQYIEITAYQCLRCEQVCIVVLDDHSED